MNMWPPKCAVILKLIRNIPIINPLNAKLNPICHLLALLADHHILHFIRIRVKCLDKVQIVELSLLQFSVAGKRTHAANMARLIVHHTHAPLSAHRLITWSYRGATLFFVWNSKWRFRFCIRRNLFVRCGSWDAVEENHSRILQYFVDDAARNFIFSKGK